MITATPARQRYALNASVFVVVCRGDHVLLLRRANTGWKDGQWSLPAGSHDGGETLEQSAARELREETGLDAHPHDMRLIHLLHARAGDNGGEWLGAFFLATHWQGDAVISEPAKHDGLDWFPLDALPDELIAYTRQGLRLGLQGTAYSSFGW